MNGKKNILTKEQEVDLVKEVYKYEVLWDSTKEIYRRSDLKNLAWEKVAKDLKLPVDGTVLSNRFKNIRETYTTNLRKVESSRRSGIATTDVFKPTWHLYEYLDYLRNPSKQAGSSSNIEEQMSLSDLVFVEETSDADAAPPNMNVQFAYDSSLQKWVMLNQLNQIADKEDQAALNIEEENLTAASVPAADISISDTPARKRPRTEASTSNGAQSEEGGYFFQKKGEKKKGTEILQEAVKALGALASQPVPSFPIEEAVQGSVSEFCRFLDSRLKELPANERKAAENNIMRVMMEF